MSFKPFEWMSWTEYLLTILGCGLAGGATVVLFSLLWRGA